MKFTTQPMNPKHSNRLGMVALAATILASGCSSNMFSKGAGGAVAGAASASLLGALTDLVVDGRVNPYRLQRNLVGGAIAGGTTGAVVGHQQDVAKEQRRQARQQKEAASSQRDKAKALGREIGDNNVNALADLLNYRHEDAYAKTLETVRSNKQHIQTAGYAIQAMIDDDRRNPEGVTEALEAFVAASSEVDNIKDARSGLTELMRQVSDERKVKGIRSPR